MVDSKNVNHPSHYAEGRKYEPVDVIYDWDLDFDLGNALKYISRAGRKNDEEEDLRKAIWYLEDYLDRKYPPATCEYLEDLEYTE